MAATTYQLYNRTKLKLSFTSTGGLFKNCNGNFPMPFIFGCTISFTSLFLKILDNSSQNYLISTIFQEAFRKSRFTFQCSEITKNNLLPQDKKC